MTIRKYKDWAGWRDGLRSTAMKSGAASIVTQLTTLLGSNAVDSMHIPGLEGIGMGWKTFLVNIVVQFVIHTAYASAQYVQNKPDPDVITEEFPTEIITKKDQ